MSERLRKEFKKINKFMQRAYEANQVIRWGGAEYMTEQVANKNELQSFVQARGVFEDVSGHAWGCIGWSIHLERICLSLRKVVNFKEINERLWHHDLGEIVSGDIDHAIKIKTSLDQGKDEERLGYIDVIEDLSQKAKERLLAWFDEFEGFSNKASVPLEVFVARWIDSIQGDHFALTFGNNLPEHSETIEKIIKKRSILRSRQLIDVLKAKDEVVYQKAAEEVEEITQVHIDLIKEADIKVDLSELGF